MKQRYVWIDQMRAIAMISMICYHGVWDLVYLYGMNWKWYDGTLAFLWQQSICWTFILLSGFCWSFSKKPLKQGLIVIGAGFVITVITYLFSYESRVIFGVLNLIGASILLLIPLQKVFDKLSAKRGAIAMFLLFAVSYGVNRGYLGFFGIQFFELPLGLYRNLMTTFLGFPVDWFYSSDYFSLLPWSFLYFTGYFLHRLWKEGILPNAKCLEKEIPVLTWIGKHSLIIYMIHQPILYGLMEIIFGSCN